MSEPRTTLGLAALARMAFAGADLTPVWVELSNRAASDLTDASAAMDMATLSILTGNMAGGLSLQAETLKRQRLYRRAAPAPGARRLLAIAAPGDLMANTPLDFLLEGSNVELLTLYASADTALPDPPPDHDLAFLAVGESEANLPILRALEPALAAWPRPLLNANARRISELTRDGVCTLLEGASGLLAPRAMRMDREGFRRHDAFPVIARPIGSHAGAGLEKFDDAAAITTYLDQQPADQFYVTPFIDYAGQDGLFRKQRIVLIEGRPYLCHHAISAHWMVHYMNAAMLESAQNRSEEAAMMQSFDDDFALRHRAAFEAMTERIGLDYFGIDCGETRDGRLLVFEADVAMIVHDMDPPDLFPYKKPQMRKVFDAFAGLLERSAGARA